MFWNKKKLPQGERIREEEPFIYPLNEQQWMQEFNIGRLFTRDTQTEMDLEKLFKDADEEIAAIIKKRNEDYKELVIKNATSYCKLNQNLKLT